MGKYESPIINLNSIFDTSKAASEIQYNSFNVELILQKSWYFSFWGKYLLILEGLVSLPASMLTDNVTSHSVIWNHWAHWAIIMASKEQKISKQAVVGTTMDMTLIITQTLETIRKTGSATSHSVTIAAYNIGLLTICGIRNKRKKLRIRT